MLKVIIADDESKVCQLICHLVDWSAFGMEVAAVVNDGKSALEAIRENRPDVVITDIRMPGYDGIELIGKAKELCPDAFFVIISGYSQFEYAKQAIRYGVENYLLKPLKKKKLEATLGRILEKHQEVHQAVAERDNLIERLQESEKKNKKNLIKALMENSVLCPATLNSGGHRQENTQQEDGQRKNRRQEDGRQEDGQRKDGQQEDGQRKHSQQEDGLQEDGQRKHSQQEDGLPEAGRREGARQAWLRTLNREYGCRLVDGFFVGVAVHPFLMQEKGPERQVYELLLSKISQILETRLAPLCEEMVNAVYEDQVICVINMAQDRMLSVKKELNRLRMEIINWREIFARVEAVIGIGGLRTQPQELPRSVREADDAVLNRMVAGGGCIMEYEAQGSGPDQVDLCLTDADLRSRILGCFERLDRDGLLKELERFRERWEAYAGREDKAAAAGRGRALYEYYRSLIRLLLFGVSNFLPDMEAHEEAWFCEKYRMSFSFEEVYGSLGSYMKELFDLYFEKRKNTSILPIRQAKQYIAENYNTNISLEDVSRLTGFNPAYFSSLFKKETGKNFTEYITEIRIGNARELLVRSNKDVADIAAQVGYTDLKYFSKVFRKITGVSPSDYRKLYG